MQVIAVTLNPLLLCFPRAVIIGGVCGVAVFQGGVVFSLLIAALSYQVRSLLPNRQAFPPRFIWPR